MLKSRILLVDDDASVRLGVRSFLEAGGYEVDEAETCGAARQRIASDVPDVVLLDYALPDGNAVELLRQLKQDGVDVPVVVLTGHGSIELAVTTIKEGAEQFLTKPVELASLAVVVERVIEHQQNTKRLQATRARHVESPVDALFACRSALMRALARDARAVAASDAPVLIQGETGTGKGVLARWIHAASVRARESLVELNCAGLPRDLLESELFGHERGAFTGATAVKPGLLEAAHRGTMFLDEIGDMDLSLQPKVLKVVEEKRFRRLGDVGERRVDIRVIAASNRDLAQLVADGRFREERWYRINTVVLRLPPLRERSEDVPAVAELLLAQLGRDIRRPTPELDPDAEQALVAHTWPGNVRELRNVLERAMLLSSSPVLRRADLRLSGLPLKPAPAGGAAVTLKELEWQHIKRVLDEEQGNVPRAARRLGIPRSTMYQKLKASKASRIWTEV
ncbi:MAG TPA: sigma-54 dependent transcriptional regulator [Vicinamibacterales bacterium]|nr:sigma-54 dependent transcriptional regulator [Vicinamibacterales bacterium]